MNQGRKKIHAPVQPCSARTLACKENMTQQFLLGYAFAQILCNGMHARRLTVDELGENQTFEWGVDDAKTERVPKSFAVREHFILAVKASLLAAEK